MDSNITIANIVTNIFIILFLLFVNAFFVAAEFSLVKIRRTRLEQLSNEGSKIAKLAIKMLDNVNEMLAAAQLGVTVASIALGWVGEATTVALIEPAIKMIPNINATLTSHAIAVPISFFLVTMFHVVLGEQLPKCMSIQYPEKIVFLIAKPMHLCMIIFKPFIWLLTVSGDAILKIFNVCDTSAAQLAHTTEELDMIVDSSLEQGVLNETEAEIIHNMFKFSDLTAKQVMIPRTDVVCLPYDISFEELKTITLENQYTRYPVFQDTMDKIIGFIHVKDVYSQSVSDKPFSIDNLLRPILLVPDTMTLDNLIIEFKKLRAQLAIVVDEFGGTSGIITLEDVLEEIIGEVQDEFDEEESNIKQISENKYSANGLMRTDEIAEFFELDEEDFDEEDIETIAGLVVKYLGRIANVNDQVEFKGLKFTVSEVDGARITKLIIEKLVEPASDSENNSSEEA